MPAAPVCSSASRGTIAAKYAALSTTASDIHEHLPVIRAYVAAAATATEIGVRHGVASWAFAQGAVDRLDAGLPVTYRAADITKQPEVAALDAAMADCAGVRYSFTEADDLKVEPWHSEVLFIDTWHVYRQLFAELKRWSPYAGRYILLHDTTLFGHTDEEHWGHGGKPVEEGLYTGVAPKAGLWPAVEDFLAGDPAWRLRERRENNNGLTVLERVAPAAARTQ